MKRPILVFQIFMIFVFSLQAQIDKIEPPFWWVGMQNPALQLMIHGNNIGDASLTIDDSDVELVKVHKADSPNYLFVDLLLSHKKSEGTIDIQFKMSNGDKSIHKYELKKRKWTGEDATGFNSSDVLYLITPDRFANGDLSNDQFQDMKEGLDRSAPYGRHGGDIKGIVDNLAYIDDMGFTAIWLNPVLENDQDAWSYHGYATTDFYHVDARFGTNEEYLELSEKARQKGIGLVMDIIVNHCGHQHWWAKDLPFSDWYNQLDTSIVYSNHRKETLLDPYVSDSDRQGMVQGWFSDRMPDLNQKNPFMSKYLIQNSIWWIEYAKLCGIRQDTYSYPYKDFMTDWTCAIMDEYPNFNIVGEEWIDDPAVISYWQQGKVNIDGYSSCLKSLMDFPLTFSMHKAFTEDEAWGKGLIRLYQSLSKDFHYEDPNELVIFPDNHDMSRIYTQLDEDYDRYKMAMVFLLTTRGVPQIFYGTEILMSHKGTDSHGAIRSDFPGGWPQDSINAFVGVHLENKQKEAQAFCKRMLNWRKTKPVIHHGALKHFIPKDGVYVYFRYDDENVIMVAINKNDKRKEIFLDHFKEMDIANRAFYNIVDKRRIAVSDQLVLEANSASVFEIY